MPLQATSGAASYDGFGGGVAAVPQYIEDVFSTYLTTGTGAAQTVTNGIDLSTYGGMVWNKIRSTSANNYLMDSARNNFDQVLYSNTTDAGINLNLINPTTSGFDFVGAGLNSSGQTYANWTFRKQPKFFDVVTYTGNGNSSRTVAHALTSQPGFIIIKRTDTGSNWVVAASDGSGNYKLLFLDTTLAAQDTQVFSVIATSSVVNVGWIDGAWGSANVNGGTYVMYLYASNAGGFGLTGTDNVISCGSYTGNGSTNGPEINLGFEPQWILYKSATTADTWYIQDTMRQWSVLYNNNSSLLLQPNSSNAESGPFGNSTPTATGFKVIDSGSSVNASGQTYIYIAIRRGPMKVPTDPTKVFAPIARSGTGTNYSETTNTNPDSIWLGARSQARGLLFFDKLRGLSKYLTPNSTSTEGTNAQYITGITNTGYVSGNDLYMNDSGATYVDYSFTRAPSFFDEVCYTGDSSSNRALNHNLGVTPELIICRSRSNAQSWITYTAPTGLGAYLLLQTTGSVNSNADAFPAVSSTTFTPTTGTAFGLNDSGKTYVAYLFATCHGVSKVTSFTGNGSSQTINCGFTAGARFVLIKRTDSTGDWYVWDSARGIVSGNDPHLSLNSTAAEVTTDDTIDTDSTGFIVNQVAATNCNVNGASYIVLAVA